MLNEYRLLGEAIDKCLVISVSRAEEIEGLAKQVKQSEDRAKLAETQVEGLNKAVTQLTKQNVDLSHRLTALLDTNEQLKANLTRIQSNIASLLI